MAPTGIEPKRALQPESQRTRYLSLAVIKCEKVDFTRSGDNPKGGSQMPQISTAKPPGRGRQFDFHAERSIGQHPANSIEKARVKRDPRTNVGSLDLGF